MQTFRLQFFPSGHLHPREGEGLGERDVGAVQYVRDSVVRCGDAVIAGGIGWGYFDQAQRRQGLESFRNSDVEGTSARRQITNDLVGEHDDERMSSRSFFKA